VVSQFFAFDELYSGLLSLAPRASRG
jgi:hypothetical protein